MLNTVLFQIKRTSFILVLSLWISSCSTDREKTTLDLSGAWNFRSDPQSLGIDQKWYAARLPETVILPGSMAENGKGETISPQTPWTGYIVDSSWFFSPDMEKYRKPGNIKVPFWLQPEKYYTGMAWYQKKIRIPANWKGSNVQLFLERCHWESRVWVDEQEAGMQNSLGTPHVFDLTRWLTPGVHTLTICIDNRTKEIDVGMNSHSISDHTQSNWNGITGRIELQSRPAVFIAGAALYPDLSNKQVKVKLSLQNETGSGGPVRIALAGRSLNEESMHIKELVLDHPLVAGLNEITLAYPLGERILLWDEFKPDLYNLNIEITGEHGEKDIRNVEFGMREFTTSGTRFMINGRETFLRGTLECAIFPLTGYPPTDTASWMRIFRIARSHGLNHMRFHSWCPPEAAFAAADHAGFYLHLECSSWANQGSAIGDGKPIDQYLYDESERMVKAYGNHPSFCILLYGNEPAGVNQEKWLTGFIEHWKSKDSRRLYSSGAGWPLLEATDFNSTSYPRIQGWGEGLNSIINAEAPNTNFDWRARIADAKKPTVSHEIGQWCVYPDFREISQYTGVLKAKNFEIFRESLGDHHMEHLADSFLLASGKLQTICYKADIEAALRTPGFAGFQLLDLHDFPGQGTALVGVLNPFWESKGYVTPQEYSRFCNSTVPLLRLPKMIYKSNEILRATAEIAHFGPDELKNVVPSWTITNPAGRIKSSGKLTAATIKAGNGRQLGEILQPLDFIDQPVKLTITLMVSDFQNSWDIWVYPARLPETASGVLVTRVLDDQALAVLNQGGKVLLTPRIGSVRPDAGGNIAVGFSSIFWNTAWTSKQAPHTLGILCSPRHPALAEFPTDYHSNWQWWDAMSHTSAMNLSGFSPELKPIVRIIDDWFTNRPLAMIFEASVGKGKIIVCGVDLLTDVEKRPEAQQLLFSLKQYMAGDHFHPAVQLEAEQIKGMFN